MEQATHNKIVSFIWGLAAQKAGGSGWHAGSSAAFDRAHCIDVSQVFAFLKTTQPDTLAKLNIGNYGDSKNITRQKFLARISSEIGKRGVIDVLRRGIDDGPLHFEMFYGTPSPGNAKAEERFAQNRFTYKGRWQTTEHTEHTQNEQIIQIGPRTLRVRGINDPTL